MIAGAKILTATTTPDSLASALGTFLRPLRRLKMPVDDLLQIMALTLKSLPRLKEEIVGNYREKISHENTKGFLNRIKVISTQLMPIFVKSMQVPERYFKEEPKGKNDGRKIDILIKNGLIFDGTGSDPFEADIGISGDRISFINGTSKCKSKCKCGMRNAECNAKPQYVIDAQGMAVAPGFIDTHGHSEFTLLADPRAEGKICQGITTEINGNCGLSAAPLYGEAFEHREADLREYDIRERWSTLSEYLGILAGRKPSLNFVTLAGHGNIRASVLGYKNKIPDQSEMQKMQALLRETVEQGAIGLSTGLIYPPGVYSATEELIGLLNLSSFIPRPSKFIYASHMRSEGDRLTESIEEIIRIGKESGIHVHISHIKTSGQKNWHKIDKALSLIEDARQNNIPVTCDRYPYTASSTDLDTVVPAWAYEGGSECGTRTVDQSGYQGQNQGRNTSRTS